jgi:hypothetical protein
VPLTSATNSAETVLVWESHAALAFGFDTNASRAQGRSDTT